MKILLISATSLVGLFAAVTGSAFAGSTYGPTAQSGDFGGIYDLVHDGITSSNGGDRAVSREDPITAAICAFRNTITDELSLGSTEYMTRATDARNFGSTSPLGAAIEATNAGAMLPGVTANSPIEEPQKARTIGQERVSSLIGTISSGRAEYHRLGSTVFLASGSAVSFYDGVSFGDGSPGAVVFAPASTRTATITIAGAGAPNHKRPDSRSYVSETSISGVDEDTRATEVRSHLPSEPLGSTVGYNYLPATQPLKRVDTDASFSNAVYAAGISTESVLGTSRSSLNLPISGDDRASQIQPPRSQSAQIRAGVNQVLGASDGPHKPLKVEAIGYGNPIDIMLVSLASIEARVDGTNSLISTSVSVSPHVNAARLLARAVQYEHRQPLGAPSIEAFEIAPPPGRSANGGDSTSIPTAISNKILASIGPLDNSLALP